MKKEEKMEVTKYIVFPKQQNADFIQYLISKNIPFVDDDTMAISIDVVTSNPHWPEIEKYVNQRKFHCLTDMEFTEEELAEADWMRIRTIWRTGYPEPSNNFAYLDIAYTKDEYCDNCGAGLEQKAPFRLAKTPSWGRRHFFAPYGLEDELFVDESARRIFESNGITGIEYACVYNKSGQKELSNIYQMKILHNLPKSLLTDNAAIRSVTQCPVCGSEKILRHGGAKMQFLRRAFNGAADIVKTAEIFGGSKRKASNVILINQKTHRIIKDNDLGRSLKFYPVDLVD